MGFFYQPYKNETLVKKFIFYNDFNVFGKDLHFNFTNGADHNPVFQFGLSNIGHPQKLNLIN
ncbi:10205_t:CDS:2 [Entrophospora sp. SA101]|nr:10205_t:CDS:2 [Entrophospora sp. SA101]